MKVERNLSGIYFRAKNAESGKFENKVFENLTEQQQDEVMMNREKEWVKALAKQLANTINIIGEQFDLTTKS